MNQHSIEIVLNSLDIRRCGRDVYFTGVTATPLIDKQAVPSGVYHQTIFIFDKIKLALQGFGAQINNLVGCTVHLKNQQDTEQFGLAFNDIFGLKKIQASVLVSDDFENQLLIRIDAHAYLDESYEPAINRNKQKDLNLDSRTTSDQNKPKTIKTKKGIPEEDLNAVKDLLRDIDPQSHHNDIVKPFSENKPLQTDLTQFEKKISLHSKKLQNLINYQSELKQQRANWLESCRQELSRHQQMKDHLKHENYLWKKNFQQTQNEINHLKQDLQNQIHHLNQLTKQNQNLLEQINSMSKNNSDETKSSHQKIITTDDIEKAILTKP